MIQTDSDIRQFAETARTIEAEIARVIVGQYQTVRNIVIAIIAGQHVLLEGVPGLGKTMLVRTLSQVLDLHFTRVQFTPDLMPADITGTTIISEDGDGHRAFQFQPGPIFTKLAVSRRDQPGHA